MVTRKESGASPKSRLSKTLMLTEAVAVLNVSVLLGVNATFNV